MNEEKTLYYDSIINDFEIICSDGSLYYSRRNMFIKCKNLRDSLKDKNALNLTLPNSPQSAVIMVLRLMDDNMETLRNDVEQFQTSYRICCKWGFDDGINYFAQRLADYPTIVDLIVLKNYDDSRYKSAVANFATLFDEDDCEKCEPVNQVQLVGVLVDVCSEYRKQHEKLHNFMLFARDIMRHRDELESHTLEQNAAKIDELHQIHIPSFVPETPQNIKKRKRFFV